MPKPKKKIGLKAISVDFTFDSIVYKVELDTPVDFENGIVLSPNNIKNKDLVLKPTLLDDNMEVIYTPVNVAPHFYQGILNENIRDISEHVTALKKIYEVGDIVGYIIV